MSSVIHDRSRRDAAQRWASIVVGAAIIFVVGWMTYATLTARPLESARLDATVVATQSATIGQTAPSTDSGQPGTSSEDVDAGLVQPALSPGDAAVMPSGAPRSVKIGVVLVTFAGAEGAPPNARTKKEAQTIAERLGADARSDFHHAVTGGDPGSADDVGRLPRGVLDPRTEIAVFGLAPGEVSDVLETPRGYWIVKRISD